MKIEDEVQFIKGIGPKRAQGFLKLGIKYLSDLLLFFPIQYQDRTSTVPISQLFSNSQACIFGRVGNAFERKLSRDLRLLDIEILGDGAKIYARFFRKKSPYAAFNPFEKIKNDFKKDGFVYIFGETQISLGEKFIKVSDYEAVENQQAAPKEFNKLLPIYPGTEILSQKIIRDIVKTALEASKGFYPDISNIIPHFKDVENLKAFQAIERLHYPKTLIEAEQARRAFAMQEFLILQVALNISRFANKKTPKKRAYEIKKNLLSPFREKLNFEFTKAQKRCINEIFEDMRKDFPMNRMLMGDVGSGKTVVALSAILLAIENGYQAMIVAPTEILARQHFLNISAMLEGLDVKTALLTSSTLSRKKARESILSEIEGGQISIAIGTHSLIEQRVKFKNLALAIVDEQHRFGVLQKMAALSKAASPDILTMTATPIPRALAMTVYGELDMSIIDELPPGRLAIRTKYTSEDEAYRFTIEEIKKGGQAYIVYPLIDESDKVQLKSATESALKLSKTYFKDFKCALLHGRMKEAEKNEIMEKFKNAQTDILMSTTVIEVGIDIPNASIMIIENAANFGLSALHQLRGRIGRGKRQSFCFLLGRASTENARRRISIMTRSNNGFEIAEEDLQMRGPGEFLGTMQHGFPDFKAGNLIKDADIIEFSKKTAAEILEDDPNLDKSVNAVLKELIIKNFGERIDFVKVG